MKECPFIDECEDEVRKEDFKSLCRARFGIFLSYKNCSTYQKMLSRKQKKPYRQKPRDWKKEMP